MLKSKKGSPEELNLALMRVLNSIGIQCSPVLIGSKGNGRSELVPFPYLNQFNEIILLARLDGESVYLDLSDPIAPFGYIDPEKHVKGGLMLVKDKSELIQIKIRHNSNTILMTDVSLKDDGRLQIDNMLRTYFYEGLKLARISKSFKDKNEPMEKLFAEDENYVYSNVEVLDELKEKNYVSTKFNVTSKDRVDDGFLEVSPFSFSSFSENPFTQEYRVFPVDFGFSFTETYNAKIKIPTGYDLDDFPMEEKFTISSGQIDFSYSPSKIEGVVNIIARIEVKDPMIDPKYYPELKFFMESVASKLNAPVIFRKRLLLNLMKGVFICIVLLLVEFSQLFAQVEFGHYSEKELALERVSFEPEAKIVTLWEEGTSYFMVNGLHTDFLFRYKVLDDNIENFGDIKIPFLEVDPWLKI
ncbi:hypothetical protein V8V91_15585 [Algoriphagus halophilus]|uniref:hypothetical protein n=1 Tax=Algoriphagus halophilus TaxID=226505 RepID=UPI00358F98F5